MFSNYPPALDPTDQAYTIAELKSNNTETPYPSAAFNSPPGGRINYTTYPPTGANYQVRNIRNVRLHFKLTFPELFNWGTIRCCGSC